MVDTAKSIANYGLRDLGYEYVIVDDCWSSGRNDTGYLVADNYTFPNGMGYVADQVHSLNMKFGIYSSAGIYTCARRPGSLGNEQKDADYFAESKWIEPMMNECVSD